MDQVFVGKFRVAYLLIKTAGLYIGTFLLCEYWPTFLSYLVAPDLLPEMELLAGGLLVPVGFLVLGAALGLRVFLVHLGLLILAGPVAYLTVPHSSDDAVQALVGQWVIIILVAYGAGAVFGARQQLKQSHAAA